MSDTIKEKAHKIWQELETNKLEIIEVNRGWDFEGTKFNYVERIKGMLLDELSKNNIIDVLQKEIDDECTHLENILEMETKYGSVTFDCDTYILTDEITVCTENGLSFARCDAIGFDGDKFLVKWEIEDSLEDIDIDFPTEVIKL